MSALAGKHVLVTGGAGFVGSHLVDELLNKRNVASLTVLDNLVTGDRVNLIQHEEDSRFRFVQADLRTPEGGRELNGIDVVFHLACLGVRHSLHDPRENHEVNATGTLVLLERARRAGVSRFIHVSSSEVYGTAQYTPMDERHPTWPETVYGAAKLAGEAYARAAWRTHGFPVTVVRPFNTYGPRSHFEGDSGEILPRTIVRALAGKSAVIYGDGQQTRDFLHVSDTARGLATIASSDRAVGQTINIGSGVETSINEVVRTVYGLVERPDLEPVHVEARPGDVRRLLVDDHEMALHTGFAPRVAFRDGVADLVAWFRTRPSTPQQMLAWIDDRNWLGSSEVIQGLS